MRNLYTINEACEHFNITRKTLFNWRKANKIKAIETPNGLMIDINSEVKSARQKLHTNDLELIFLIHDLHKKIDKITQELHNLKQSTSNAQVKNTQKITQGLLSTKGANEARQEEAINKARAKFIELGSPQISRAELARQAGVDRNTVGKHWEKITQKNLDGIND